MTEVLQATADRLRSVVGAGDFDGGRAALDTYAAELRQALKDTRDGATTGRLEQEWNELVIWTRSMAATARELAHSDLAQLESTAKYRMPRPDPKPSIVDARG
jgi:hypothetical protein